MIVENTLSSFKTNEGSEYIHTSQININIHVLKTVTSFIYAHLFFRSVPLGFCNKGSLSMF